MDGSASPIAPCDAMDEASTSKTPPTVAGDEVVVVESSGASDSDSGSSDEEDGTIHTEFLYRLMTTGASPRKIFIKLMELPDTEATMQQLSKFSDGEIWRLLFETVSRRQKLRQYNTLLDAVELIQRSRKIVVLTGAGISVSCGIPDFRSPNGIYKRLKEEYPELRDPSHMFSINFFKNNQQPFFSFAKELYPGKFQPSVTHHFLKALEDRGKLLRNYTQNIDTLEAAAGVKNVVLCHGSFATASCLECRHKVTAEDIRADVMEGKIPKCSKCTPQLPLSVYKPDIVFFGEDLSADYYTSVGKDVEDCDLLIVIGTTLTVAPVSSIPRKVATVPQIIINREPVTHHAFDIELLGDADIVTQQLLNLLGWSETVAPSFKPLREESQESVRMSYWQSRNPDPCTPEDFKIVALREMYETRNLAAWLPESRDVYMFVPPARYIFPGATVIEVDRDDRKRGLLRRNPLASSSSSSSSSGDEDIVPPRPTENLLAPDQPSTSK
ncbi:NAD-dependent histone deacetylase Sir2 [Hypsibius exemplaris]|uniref:NAD-dependent histone deacetylase Sir2 n=1 Tax=Hypsibius exemplaris TaxID=2072580 RepID=A0A1W0WKE8_HYPEX|nr:NAD-dependent histone deacetylase Sir2 [Hypsibius exemplaris]